ncbi:hypothetical protein [Haloarcula sediminis]|uniref:hypothetical protein n=1 Tax=Haloarcula sediminis TaxID=3111777 RepID=UPI002D769C3F|nr:hypothetical protein [Haloarcula sp. CK38]
MFSHRFLLPLVVLSLVVGATAGAQANTTSWQLDTDSQTVTFEPGDGDTLRHTVEVTNNDPNVSVQPTASIGGGHSVVSQPGQLGPGETGEIVVELDADGSESATLDVSGGGKTERVDYTVQTPAYVELSDVPDWVEDDGVLRGESRTATITVEEVGGYSGFRGMSVSGDTAGLDVGGLEGATVSAGGSTTVRVRFTADSGASQYDDIGGDLRLDPDDGLSVEREQTLESFVAYPAQFGSVDLDPNRITFDEPRSSGQITKTAEIDVENAGDRQLEFRGIRFESGEFDVSVVDEPRVIPASSTETVEVEVTASTGLSEGTYDLDGTVESNDASVADRQLDERVTVTHGIRMGLSSDDVSVGDIPIGNTKSTTVTVSEELGYRDVRDVNMRLVDGPADWITVVSPPGDSISSGSSQTVNYRVEFPPAADIGTTYTWTYAIEGEDVESRDVTVRATPIPLNLDPIRTDLNDASTDSGSLDRVSEQTLGMVNDADERIRDGDLPREDLPRVLTFSDSVVRYLEAVDAAEQAIGNGNNDAAQAELVRAAVAFDTMSTYGDAIQDDQLRSRSDSIRETAAPELEGLLSEQEQHYQEQLASNSTSPLQEATIKGELARIASLQGDTERASRLESESGAAFERYRTRVAEGEAARQNATQAWDGMQSDIFVTVAGQPLVLNPLAYDEFEARSETVLTAYSDSSDAFSAAGESARAETVASERSQRASQITTARYSLFAVSGLTVLLVLALTVHTVRGMYWYVQDSEASISGDFLV